jgi:hypothetical protein
LRALKPLAVRPAEEIYGGSTIDWGTLNADGDSEYNDLVNDAFGLSWSKVCTGAIPITFVGVTVNWI